MYSTIPVTRSSWAPTITLLRSAENSVSPRVSVTLNTLACAHSKPSLAAQSTKNKSLLLLKITTIFTRADLSFYLIALTDQQKIYYHVTQSYH